MSATITAQPVSSTKGEGLAHTFTVSATGVGTLSYVWYVDDVEQPDSDSATFSGLIATSSNSFSRVYVGITDSDDGSIVFSDTVFAISTPNSLSRHALLWNYNNNTFSWKDPAVEQPSGQQFFLFNTDYQTYGFSPGFQQRWEDWKSGAFYASTWADDTTTSWADTFSRGSDREMIMISQGQAFEGNKVINRDGSLKKYFVERSQIDFDGLSPEFRSGKIKQTKRFVMDIQADQRQIQQPQSSTINFYVGWSLNLMEPPNYKPAVVFDLQSRYFGGSYKVDYRSSGRYMGMYFDLTDAAQMSFSGGEVEVAQSSGR